MDLDGDGTKEKVMINRNQTILGDTASGLAIFLGDYYPVGTKLITGKYLNTLELGEEYSYRGNSDLWVTDGSLPFTFYQNGTSICLGQNVPQQ